MEIVFSDKIYHTKRINEQRHFNSITTIFMCFSYNNNKINCLIEEKFKKKLKIQIDRKTNLCFTRRGNKSSKGR